MAQMLLSGANHLPYHMHS